MSHFGRANCDRLALILAVPRAIMIIENGGFGTLIQGVRCGWAWDSGERGAAWGAFCVGIKKNEGSVPAGCD